MAQEAKTRLTKIVTQAVGLVDHPANLRPFLTLKANTNMPDPIADNGAAGSTPGVDGAQPDNGPPPESAARPLTMPSAVKQGLSDGLATLLARLTGIAEKIQGATVDESAEIPTEPLFELDALAADADALADQWIMEEEAAEMAPGAEGGMGEAQMAAPPATADGAPAAKSLAPATKAKVKADEMPRRKARLIAKKRATALKAVHGAMGDVGKALGACHKDLDGILKELAGEAGAKPKAEPPKPEEPAKKSVGEEISAAVAPLIAKLDAALAAATKAAPPAAPPGNRQIEEGGGPPAPAQREPSFKKMLADAKKKG